MTSRQARTAVAVAAALAFSAPIAQARQLAAAFEVGISLHSGATCGLKQASGTSQVRCHSGDFVFGALLRRDELVLDGDGFAGLGTTAEYRVVSTPDRQYLELMVGW